MSGDFGGLGVEETVVVPVVNVGVEEIVDEVVVELEIIVTVVFVIGAEGVEVLVKDVIALVSLVISDLDSVSLVAVKFFCQVVLVSCKSLPSLPAANVMFEKCVVRFQTQNTPINIRSDAIPAIKIPFPCVGGWFFVGRSSWV